MYTEKNRTWTDNWNIVMRRVIFPDEKLKDLMMIPKGTNILDFQNKYFLEDVSPDELIFNEKVRVAYYDQKGGEFGNPHVFRKYKEFEIFVKDDYVHNATNDMLQERFRLIAERIKYLLLNADRSCHLKFEYKDEFNLWTKMVGYKRYSILFEYKTTV